MSIGQEKFVIGGTRKEDGNFLNTRAGYLTTEITRSRTAQTLLLPGIVNTTGVNRFGLERLFRAACQHDVVVLLEVHPGIP